MKRDLVQGLVLIAAAIVCALVSNAVAGRERKLVLPGFYPSALKVPPRERVAEPPAPTTTTTQSTAVPPAPTPMPIKPAPQPTGPATQQAPKPAAPQHDHRDFPPHPDKAYIEIGYDDVAWLHRHGVLFLDARRTSVYEEGHIAGARPYSVWESDIDEKVNKLYEERNDPREQLKPIVIYCSGGDCEDSHMLAQKLWGVQFNNLYVYKDGFPDWQKRGGAVRVGATP